tara:strand:- start:86 stop:496 length:411 start_codon:yes stop_codon:yes gene_type:complete
MKFTLDELETMKHDNEVLLQKVAVRMERKVTGKRWTEEDAKRVKELYKHRKKIKSKLLFAIDNCELSDTNMKAEDFDKAQGIYYESGNAYKTEDYVFMSAPLFADGTIDESNWCEVMPEDVCRRLRIIFNWARITD